MSSKTQIALIEAVKTFNLGLKFYDDYNVLIGVLKNGKEYFFTPNNTPLDKLITRRITNDKFLTYQLINEVIKTPYTQMFIDPNVRDALKEYREYLDIESIVDKMEERFNYPFIIKMNSGSLGRNVFLCKNRSDINKSLEIIFDKSSIYYDHVVLAQEYIQIEKEYRVITVGEAVVLVYIKNNSKAEFVGNLSPLHWKGANADIVSDIGIINSLQNFIKPVLKKLDIKYAGFDVILDKNNNFYMLEINSCPAYGYLVENNGIKPLVNVYKEILKILK